MQAKGSTMSEFQEIGHCGGKFTIGVKTDGQGQKSLQFGMTHSRVGPAAFIGIYILPQGIPVGIIQLGGIGQSFNPPPFPSCLPVLMASDSQGKFGHECPTCNSYWRSGGPPVNWPMTCPYCGDGGEGHAFLTQGQRRYLEACAEAVDQAIATLENGEASIDMDQVADLVGKDAEKPKFYYAEQSQQKRFNCTACGAFNDVLGRYAYCSNCGTHNGFQELKSEVDTIRGKIGPGEYENTVKSSVSAFDSFARQLTKQLTQRVPMTEKRQKEWGKKLFHALKPCVEALNSVFDISLFEKLTTSEIEFAILMFHRRHIYEHNGGEADQKYINNSGDKSVRVKQTIRENERSAKDICELILKMGGNFHQGFHEIFPPEKMPLNRHNPSKP